MKKLLGKSLFKLAGWQYHVDESLLEDKQVLIGFEHTSNLDAILFMALCAIVGIRANTMIKKEAFTGPLKPLLTRLGGIPVDRTSKKDLVGQMVDEFQKNRQFSLAIAPEATRAKDGAARKPIKTGFWHIAKAANVPIILMYANPKTKTGGVFAKIYPTILEDDLQLIKEKYAELGIEINLPSSL